MLGEVCSHVAALLFKVEAACRLGYINPSRTSLPCKWNNHVKRKLPALKAQSKVIRVHTGPQERPERLD